ncbi:hypothetical protein AVEN_93496-1 [Araneus ventricosus]|uniref:Mos1 transposase HTH domain-containing protein n=1 Tax=Araneus ventricosus TaxID=182803 RepID=A0A4Y2AP92_ARAVE|nr:hypothetical protein AVEN_93496-1 [Araneus ventricosus]
MFKTIADPADCEMRSVIRFLNAKKVKPAEIHRQLVEIYGENVMTDGMIRKWVRQFNDGRTNIHDGVGDLLLSMMRDFRGRRLDSDDDAESGVQQWPSSLAASFFEEGIDKLVSRYDKCLNNGSNYVEK